MKAIRRLVLLAAVIGMWAAAGPKHWVQAQGSCTTTVSNLFGSPNCEQQLTTCENTCGSNQTCRNNCLNKSYKSCLSQNQQICSASYCGAFCGGTTGAVCCNYVDSAEGCSYGCGCPLPAPQCSGATCVGTSWSCVSPILLDLNGDGFDLTSPEFGVWFDLADSGHPQKWSWTNAKSDDGFLALDRNGDGIINDGSELFGSYTPQPPSNAPNGFLALAVFDKPENGGNDDGFIDEHDAVYSKLRVWVDSNHDGVSQPEELHTLKEVGIAKIDLQYQVSMRTDKYGNDFHYRARVWDARGQQGGRWAWDVYLHRDLNSD